MKQPDFPPAIFLMGPTASGKTALAVQLAEQLQTEIISVDSALVYKGMDIGTAKPRPAERHGIVHHLIDILEPTEVFSTGHFRTAALQLMDDLTRQGKIPILAGGTMLYFNALFNGLAELPEANAEIRQKLDKELATFGNQVLHARLQSIDPESAQRIHPNDPQRIQRALEVYEISGKPISWFFHAAQQDILPYHPIKLIVAPEDRKQLHEKIARRFRLMIEQGLIDEVRGLYNRGDLNVKMPSVRAVGYRQVWSYLEGDYDREQMIDKGIVATRQLAKRQFTWLRREQDALQFNADDENLAFKVLQAILVK